MPSETWKTAELGEEGVVLRRRKWWKRKDEEWTWCDWPSASDERRASSRSILKEKWSAAENCCCFVEICGLPFLQLKWQPRWSAHFPVQRLFQEIEKMKRLESDLKKPKKLTVSLFDAAVSGSVHYSSLLLLLL